MSTVSNANQPLSHSGGSGRKRSGDEEDGGSSESKKARAETSDRFLTAGRIVSIELENFMCHEQMSVHFDVVSNNCFYIGGPNGSGKSAMFAAMNIGLGGRGNHNDRGSSVKCYIKEGKKQAKVRITLTNRGQGACKNLEDFVVVERSINQSCSTYNIKTYSMQGGRKVNEQKVSTKKTELDKILRRFSIQLENPIFWMTQDRSRHFLQNMKPEMLYKIFICATELDHVREVYDKVTSILQDIHRLLGVLENSLAQRKKEIKKIQEQQKQDGDIFKKRIELNDLSWLMLFTPLRDALEEMEHNEKKKEKCTEKQREINGQIEEIEKEQEMETKQKKEVIKELELAAEESKANSRARSGKYSEMMEVENEKKDIEALVLQKGSKAKGHRQVIRDVKNEIAKLERRMAETDASDEKNRLLTRLESCEKQLTESMETCRSAELKRTEVSDEEEKCQQVTNRMATKLKQIVEELRRKEQEIENAKAIKANSLARFGRDVPLILSLINQNSHRFKHKPIGPLGMYITTSDSAWMFAVEQAITSQNLCAFACDNGEDKRTFDLLLSQNKIARQTCIVSSFSTPPHDTRMHEPPPQFPTVDRVLQYSSGVVRNLLVDLVGVEGIILLESDEDARDILFNECPANVRFGMTKDGGKGYGRKPNSMYRFYPYYGHNTTPKYLSESTKDENFLQKELEDLRKKVEQAQVSMKQEEKKLQKVVREKETIVREVRDFKTKQQGLMNEKKTLQRGIEKWEEKDEESSMSSYKETLLEYEGLLESILKEKESLAAKLKETNDLLEEKKKELTDLDEICRKAEKKVSQLERKANEMEAKLEEITSKHDVLLRKKEKLQAMLQELQEKYATLQIAKEDAEKRADESKKLPPPTKFTYPPDMKSLPRSEDVKEAYLKLQQQIDSILRMVPRATVSREEFSKMKEEYQQLYARVKKLARTQNILQECLEHRQQRFPIIRHAIALRLKMSFKKLMSIRNYHGHLRIHHDKKLIEIAVQTHERRKEDHSKRNRSVSVQQDLKGLSGGERSYTTAAFIMSLWEIMEAPFRCMDEFDVFMDMVNRKVVMDLLVKLATEHFSSSQFIFFTPQGIRELSNKNRVQVFEMPRVRP